MKISEVAKKLGLSPKTIRFYEDQGLIAPKRATSESWFTSGKNRVFGQEDLSRLDFVKKRHANLTSRSKKFSQCWIITIRDQPAVVAPERK
ncbi:MAG: MerR family transcriptional regulator [Gammaproteobacteria bacterium]|nr:MerR family transcriptional regulator [Gammaproteobacteria bacterium]MBU0847799.1 MerR family transcriptional regulator [Gammaproteobacteria bacterium]MBU1267067.1 MerR family transcriptional regulator [Gammaproteobacteria bacterium]MBU1527943.1 MerR family transcriptional regulator [Gammaproteobacteria bacterium]MBU1778772.1 MerR family transcriptional regulator [Gammaproteobacteria bacterium]